MKNLYLFLLFVAGVASAQIVNIPDANFKARLIWNGYDTNTDNEIQVSEAQAVTGTVNLNQSFFTDMTGIEAFTNAQYLYCEQNNSITSVSIANMPNWKAIHFSENQNLQTLTITNLTGLDTLKCNNSKLTGALNLTGAANLKSINVNNNFLTSLNISTCIGLKQLFYGNNNIQFANLFTPPPPTLIEELDCSSNGLTSSSGLMFFSAVKKLNCGSNAMPNFSLTNLIFLEELYCSNNQIATFSLTDGGALKVLEIQGNPAIPSLDLTAYPNLERAYVVSSNLSSINVTGLTNLKWFYCPLGSLTTLDVSSLTNLEVLSCAGNSLTTVDVSNLTHLKELYCNNSLMTTMNITNTPALEILDCQASQLSSLDLTGHANLKQLNCSNNPFNTLDLSPCPNLIALACWQLNLTSLDISMLPNLTSLSCHDNDLTTLDCSNNHVLTFLDIYANPLETLFIKNGSQQYFNDAGNFVENPNLAYICADEEEIAYLQGKPGMNASINSYCSMAPGDETNTITGTIRFDNNDNGCDASDVTPQFVKLDVTGSLGTGSVYTNTSGQYVIYTGAGDTFVSVNLENGSYFLLVLPFSEYFPAADGSTVNQDICLSATGVHPDLETVISPIAPARPGFDAVYKVVYKNKGNQVANGDIAFVYDENHMSFVGADSVPSINDGGVLGWDYSNLMPFESRSVLVTLHINAPTDLNFPVNVNDIFQFDSYVNPATGDETTADNHFTYMQTVIGSYDPNDIYCIEGDVVSSDKIGDYLHYTINFENTGTDIAENIVVIDDIDASKFDISSLRIINSSDDVDVAIEGTKAKFFFRDIKLPIGGHGNILLKMRSNIGLAAGDSVVNAADIYFDYNLPIETNDATTLYQLLGVPESGVDNSVSVYPNPAKNVVNIKANNEIKSVELFDAQGRLLQKSLRNATDVSVDVSQHQTGIYYLRIASDKGIKVQKIIKE